MRKEIYLGIIVLVAALFIASCVPVATTYICADGKKVNDPSLCTPATTKETQEEEEPEPVLPEEPKPVIKVFSEAAQALLSKSSKVSSVQYGYVESPMVLPENIYYVTKDKMKIVLKTKVRFTDKESYDTVYLDLVQKTAVAYCEDRNIQLCPDKDREFTVNVNFEDYYKETPFVWLDSLTKADLTGRSKTFASRNAIEVSFEINGEPGTMFVDSFFSMPLQISFKGKNYEFRDIVMNEVDSEDIEHQLSQ